MIKNYFVTAWRSILKHKFVSVINLGGLVAGMSAFVMIIQFVLFEVSYDSYHENRENIYRVESSFIKNGIITDDWATSSGGYGPAMQREFPAIKQFTRVYLQSNERIVSYEDVKHREKNVFFADPNFFEVFTFGFVNGNPATALREPNTIVISESAAKKYFKNKDPIGQTLKLSTTRAIDECTVTGVFRDIPANSHLDFDILVSWATLSSRFKGVDEFWYQHSAYTYIELEPGTNPAQIVESFPALGEKHKTLETMKSHTWAISLVPLGDIHLNAAKSNEHEIKGSRSAVTILAVAALLTLIIAWVNYVNLATTRAMERAKEISIRKTAGATKGMLVNQFLVESFFMNFVALCLALLINWITHPHVQSIINTEFPSVFELDTLYLLTLAAVFLGGVLFSGLYPAIILSSFQPMSALKGQLLKGTRGGQVRKVLVTFQFVVSIVLVTVSVVVFQQLKFMKTKSTGIDTRQVIVIKIPGRTENYHQKLESLRNGLLGVSAVNHVTLSSSIAGQEVGMNLANRRADIESDQTQLFEMLRTDPDFIETYKLEILHGRNFSRDVPSDSQAVILNEEAVKHLGYKSNEDALNKEIYLETSTKKFEVIGIAKNYHHTSMRDKFVPTMLFISPDFGWIPYSFISVKATSSEWGETVSQLKSKWDVLFPESSFDYFFLNEYVDHQYRNDVAFGKLVNFFCGLIIVIACLGLLGLASYDVILKKKEVGIRQVLGASAADVLLLFSKDVALLLAIACTIGLPIAYLVSASWLENYSFKTSIEVWMLVAPVIILWPIAVLTVLSQAIKAVVSSPIESLRCE